MGEATVRLEDLFFAHEQGALQRPERVEGDRAEAGAVVAECPTCRHPSMVALASGEANWKACKLVPVRTDADARLLLGGELP